MWCFLMIKEKFVPFLARLLQKWSCVLLSAWYQEVWDTDMSQYQGHWPWTLGHYGVCWVSSLQITITSYHFPRGADCFEILLICYFYPIFHPLILSISGSCLQQLLLWYLPHGGFIVPSFLLYLLIGIV